MITIEQGTDDSTVEVRAERVAKASSDEAAQTALKQLEIREDVKPDAVRLETKAPQSSGRTNHEVRYFIKVPRSITVEARTTNGGVRLNGIVNEVTASSVNGGIKGDGLSGHIDANTTNGGVEIDLASVSAGGVRLETVNGGVQLQVPKTAKADISARVVNGGVHIDDSLALESAGEKSRRRRRGTPERRRQPHRARRPRTAASTSPADSAAVPIRASRAAPASPSMNEDKSTRYHRLQRRASVASFAWSAALLVVLASTSWSVQLRDGGDRASRRQPPLGDRAVRRSRSQRCTRSAPSRSRSTATTSSNTATACRASRCGGWLLDHLKGTAVGLALRDRPRLDPLLDDARVPGVVVAGRRA